MVNLPELSKTLTAFHSDLNRIQTIAGTLSQMNRQHYNALTRYNDERLAGIAVADQNSSRQLGEIKQLCLAMAQKIEDIQQTMGGKQGGEL